MRFKDRQYKGWTISGRNVYGMWRADRVGHLPLAADTLQGLKNLITHNDSIGANAR